MTNIETDELERAFLDNLAKINENKDNFEEEDLNILQIVQQINNKQDVSIPEATKYEVSTRSAKCRLSDKVITIHLGRLATYITQKILDSYFEKNRRYPIMGMQIQDLIVRYDELFIKKYKRPSIKYGEELINPFVEEDCRELVERIRENEWMIFDRQGRQKDNKKQHFYNYLQIFFLIFPDFDP